MGLTRSQIDAELQALYDQIPEIPDCDGRCWTTCGPIEMADRERQRILRAGVRITPWQQAVKRLDGFWCEALTGEKRCAVYEMRPLLCRIWGAVEGLECVYGCRPEGGRLPEAEGYRLIMESLRIGGGSRDIPADVDLSEMMAGRLRPAIERIRAKGKAGDLRHMRSAVPPAFRASR